MYSNYEKFLKVAVHELGHGLGLNDMNNTGEYTITQQGYYDYTLLGRPDISTYRYLWG